MMELGLLVALQPIRTREEVLVALGTIDIIPVSSTNPTFCPVHLVWSTFVSLWLTLFFSTLLSTLMMAIRIFRSPKKEVNLTLTILLLTTVSEVGSLPPLSVL